MFDDVLIESAGKDKKKGAWVSTLLSFIIHVGLIGAVITAGYYVKKNPDVIQRPMPAFLVGTSSPAPPPPPPPPPAPSSSVATTPVRVEHRETTQPVFQQPAETPTELPQVSETQSSASSATPSEGGMPGGEEGGVVGGTVGGQKGGEIGGTLSGTIGGTGTGKPGGGNTMEIPIRVGGNVLPPKIVTRVDPQYTEAARRAKVQGVVIIEAVIDRNGNVTDARILKPLPFGLDQQALKAILAWKFTPGTLNGQAVPVYYNLTVNFQID